MSDPRNHDALPDDLFRNRIATALAKLDRRESDADIAVALDSVDAEPIGRAAAMRILGHVRRSIAAAPRDSTVYRQANRTAQGADAVDRAPGGTRPASPKARVSIVVVCLALLLANAVTFSRFGGFSDNSIAKQSGGAERPLSTQLIAVAEPAHRASVIPMIPRANPGETLTTGPREKRRVTLPDGSVLSINEHSKVTIVGPRRIKLLAGELFVEVIPAALSAGGGPGGGESTANRERFVVETPKRQVTALGTKFVVKADGDATKVIVTQGKVQVSGVAEIVEAGRELIADRAESNSVELRPARRSAYVLEWVKDLMAAAGSLVVPTSEHAGGTITVVDPQGQEMKLSLRSFHVDVHIEDGFARTTIDQTYFNHTWQQLEGTFRFPLPADASLSRLAMYVNGTLMEGGMVERDYGRNVFEQIRHTRRDPALLEWVDGSTFQMRVFPLEARQEKRILLSYTQRLPSDYGKSVYRFPAGHSLEAVRNWSASVRVKGGAGTKWYSPSHLLDGRHDHDDLLIEGREEYSSMERDLVLELGDETQVATSKSEPVWSRVDQEGFQYLMLRMRPELKAIATRSPRHWIFLVENSADRNTILAETQRQIAKVLLENLEHSDTISVIRAGTQPDLFREKPVDCSLDNVAAALQFLKKVAPIGALDLSQALQAVQQQATGNRETWIIHLGTGIPVLGERDQTTLMRQLPAKGRYVGVAVGKRWSKSFMETAASHSGGHVVQINPDEAVAWRAFDLLSTLNAPRLTEIAVSSEVDKQVADVPRVASVQFLPLTNWLSHGQEFAAVARVRIGDALPKSVVIAGKVNGEAYSQTVTVPESRIGQSVDPLAISTGHGSMVVKSGHLPRTWARREIDRLVALGATENKTQIVELSKSMYVMSPFTSLLVLETDAMYEQFKVDRGRKDHWAMYGAPAQIPVIAEPGPAQLSILDSAKERLKLAQARAKTAESNYKRSVTDKRPALDLTRLERLKQAELADVKLLTMEIQRIERANEAAANPVRQAWESVIPRRVLWQYPYTRQYTNYWNYWGETNGHQNGGWGMGGGPRRDGYFTINGSNPNEEEDTILSLGINQQQMHFNGLPSAYYLNGHIQYFPQVPGLRASHRIRAIEPARQDVRGRGEKISVIGRIDFDGDGGSDREQFHQMLAAAGVMIDNEDRFKGFPQAVSFVGSGGFSGLHSNFRSFNGSGTGGGSGMGAPGMQFPLGWADAKLDWEPIPLGASNQVTPLLTAGVPAGLVIPRTDVAFAPYFIDSYRNGIVDVFGIEPGREIERMKLMVTPRIIIQGEEEELLGLKQHVSRRYLPPILSREAAGFIPRAWPSYTSVQHPLTSVLQDLPSYAPGLQTWAADRLAIAEQASTNRPASGTVDFDARRLIEKARSLGWENVRLVSVANGRRLDRDNTVITVDGLGRFRIDRELSEGLKETVINDGSVMWHLYPEIGLGAKRTVSRFHQPAVQSLVPWYVPTADELSLNGDVKTVGERTVRITPTGEAASTIRSMIELVFAEEGRLSELRVIDRQSNAVLFKQAFTLDGTVRLLDTKDKVLAEVRYERRSAEAPNLAPMTIDLVVLPLPYRSSGSVGVSVPVNLQDNTPDFAKLSDEDALKLLATYFAEARQSELVNFIEQRFAVRGDHRIGLAVLMSSVMPQNPLVANATKQHLDLPLAKFLEQFAAWATTGQLNTSLDAGDNASLFLKRICGAYNHYDRWATHKVVTRERSEAEIERDLAETLRYVRDCHSLDLALRLLSTIEDALKQLERMNSTFARQLNAAAAAIATDRDIPAFARQSRIEWLLLVGDDESLASAKELFRSHLAESISEGTVQRGAGFQPDIPFALQVRRLEAYATWTVPALRSEIRAAFAKQFKTPEGQSCGAWADLVKEAAQTLSTRNQPLALIVIARQCVALSEAALAAEIFQMGIKDQNLAVKPQLNLAALQYAKEASDWGLAEACVQRVLSDANSQSDSSLWRDAANIARQRLKFRESIEFLEKAYELEFAALPKTVNLETFRQEYQSLFEQLEQRSEQLAEASREDQEAFSRIVQRAAARWREIDSDDTSACHRTARILTKLGQATAAWNYWTTPLSEAPDLSSVWTTFATAMDAEHRFNIADKAWSTAFACEPTNPEILLQHSQFLRNTKQEARAQTMLTSITSGNWQPRFDGTKAKAQTLLTGQNVPR